MVAAIFSAKIVRKRIHAVSETVNNDPDVVLTPGALFSFGISM
jgi:hypothetical protein